MSAPRGRFARFELEELDALVESLRATTDHYRRYPAVVALCDEADDARKQLREWLRHCDHCSALLTREQAEARDRDARNAERRRIYAARKAER